MVNNFLTIFEVELLDIKPYKEEIVTPVPVIEETKPTVPVDNAKPVKKSKRNKK